MSAAPEWVPGRAVDRALRELADGGVVAVIEDREDGDEGPVALLVACADRLDATTSGRLLRHGGGILTVAMPARAALAMGAADGEAVDARSRRAGGLSASDRAEACRAIAGGANSETMLTRPGHVFIRHTADGGVLERGALEEAAVDLVTAAVGRPAAVLGTFLGHDGEPAPATVGALTVALPHAPIVTLDEVLTHRLAAGRLVEHVVETRLPTPDGMFTAHGYRAIVDDSEHLALTMGDLGAGPTLVRVHRSCRSGDIFGAPCGCRHKLDVALRRISADGRGVLVHLRHDSADGLTHPTNPMDPRHFGLGAQILVDLGLHRLRLLTNSRHRYPHLAAFGLEITERVPLLAPVGEARSLGQT